jgi:hypothetical protein
MASTGLFLVILCTGFILLFIPAISRKLPLASFWMAALLGIKVFVALCQAYLYFHLYPATSDAWGWFDQSRQLAGLIHDPQAFYRYALPHAEQWTDIFHYNFWNNVKQNIVVLILYGLNPLTFKNPYTDTLICSFLTFIGWIALLRLLKGLYPGWPSWVYCLPFLFPTFLFFYSGLHADGLIFALLGWFGYRIWIFLGRPSASKGPAAPSSPAPSTIPATSGSTIPSTSQAPSGSPVSSGGIWVFFPPAVLLFCMKPYLMLLLLPLSLGWWLVYHKGVSVTKAWGLILFLSVVILIGSGPEQMAQRQAYLDLHMIFSPPLDQSNPGFHVGAYLAYFPKALWKGIARPAIGEPAYGKYLYCGIESLCLWLFALTTLLYRPKNDRSLPFYEFYGLGWLYFCFLNILLIGYTIPLVGGLVRYRALFYPFILSFTLFPLIIWRRTMKKN